MTVRKSQLDERYAEVRLEHDSGSRLRLVLKTVVFAVVAAALAVAFVLNLLVPDPVLVVDELLLGAGAVVAGRQAMRTRAR